MDALAYRPFYRRRLPHLQPVGQVFFVTFRLYGSIPQRQLFAWRRTFEQRIARFEAIPPESRTPVIEAEREAIFKFYDDWLDGNPNGPYHLQNPAVAEVVTRELHRHDGALYQMLAYCIMPNHVHLLFDTSAQIVDEVDLDQWEQLGIKPLNVIMQRIKGASARYANEVLGRSGSFWQAGSYDHYVRNAASLQRIYQYILDNPVKAGLVKNWEDFPFSYAAHSAGGFQSAK